MKNEQNGNQDFEKLLREKMAELSESVNCFDKISARAFPKEDVDFTESEFTVSGLENVTGRESRFRVLKRMTALAVAALVIAVLPQTTPVRKLLANLMPDRCNRTFCDMTEEIQTEMSKNVYTVFDVPLEDYIENDLMITPMAGCPFEDSGQEDVSVRIYIRTIDNIFTNQVYAEEYTGTYSETNIMAVASTKAEFTDDDINTIKNGDYQNHFPKFDDDKNYVNLSIGRFINTSDNGACFAYYFEMPMYFKSEDEIFLADQAFTYGIDKTTGQTKFFYDTTVPDADGGEITLPEYSDVNSVWDKSIYYTGQSAIPENNNSVFVKKDIFDTEILSTEAELSKAETNVRYNDAYTDYYDEYSDYPDDMWIYINPLEKLTNTESVGQFLKISVGEKNYRYTSDHSLKDAWEQDSPIPYFISNIPEISKNTDFRIYIAPDILPPENYTDDNYEITLSYGNSETKTFAGKEDLIMSDSYDSYIRQYLENSQLDSDETSEWYGMSPE